MASRNDRMHDSGLTHNLFYVLCALCVGIWIISYFRTNEVQYLGLKDQPMLGVSYGSVYFGNFHDPPFAVGTWRCRHETVDFQMANIAYLAHKYRFMGFAYNRYSGRAGAWDIYIPLWFITSVSGSFAWFAWCKRKLQTASKAFPVEPNNKYNDLG